MKLKQIEKILTVALNCHRPRCFAGSTLWQVNMADRRKKSWSTFKNEMKAKRRKTGDSGAKKNEKGNILERQELVVQRLSSEVSGKAQKYTRVGPREFVPYDWNAKDCPVCFGRWAGAILSLNEAHSRFKGDPRTICQVIEHSRQQADCKRLRIDFI